MSGFFYEEQIGLLESFSSVQGVPARLEQVKSQWSVASKSHFHFPDHEKKTNRAFFLEWKTFIFGNFVCKHFWAVEFHILAYSKLVGTPCTCTSERSTSTYEREKCSECQVKRLCYQKSVEKLETLSAMLINESSLGRKGQSCCLFR